MRQEENEANTGELIGKVVCVVVVGVFMTSTVISVDKPEINLPPNYHEPHEAPANSFMPQWLNNNNIFVASTVMSGTVNSIGYKIL